MKNVLIVLAGGMMGYGVFLLMKMKAAKETYAAPRSAQPASKTAPALTMTETTEYVPAYAGMLGHFDARPEATFAPPKTYVAVPGAGVTDLITGQPGGTLVLE
jgi:hypothetical protein